MLRRPALVNMSGTQRSCQSISVERRSWRLCQLPTRWQVLDSVRFASVAAEPLGFPEGMRDENRYQGEPNYR